MVERPFKLLVPGGVQIILLQWLTGGTGLEIWPWKCSLTFHDNDDLLITKVENTWKSTIYHLILICFKNIHVISMSSKVRSKTKCVQKLSKGVKVCEIHLSRTSQLKKINGTMIVTFASWILKILKKMPQIAIEINNTMMAIQRKQYTMTFCR